MIKNYAEKFEQAEQARKELESLIQAKTGYRCSAYAEKYPHQDETTYKIVCMELKGFVAISKLFTDRPFYQEKINRNYVTNRPEKDIRCVLTYHGSKLVISTSASMENYKKWMEMKHA